eukprot:scaffold104491_cov60-Phaeocystis_antarctica.AAC.2
MDMEHGGGGEGSPLKVLDGALVRKELLAHLRAEVVEFVLGHAAEASRADATAQDTVGTSRSRDVAFLGERVEYSDDVLPTGLVLRDKILQSRGKGRDV